MSERAIKVIRGLRRCAPFSLSPRAIIETEANRHSAAQMPFFVLRRRLRKRAFDAPPYHKKIAQPLVVRFASFRDSVGIRTQDPQLRRLLLYPTELPNRSVCFPGTESVNGESGCKGNAFFRICKKSLLIIPEEQCLDFSGISFCRRFLCL